MNQVRFLHTADWQVGMRRHFLGAEDEPRFRQARIDAIRALAEVARAEACEFAVVCGDAFESNQIDRGTFRRALEALDEFPCPVYLLPGNHDPYDAGSLYRSAEIAQRAQVVVLTGNEPVTVKPGVEIVGAPWTSKRPRRDLVAEACATLEPADGVTRICVAHGIVDSLAPRERPESISLAGVGRALEEGRIHFLALGDRHSATEVAPRVWYSGAPEATDFREVEPGHALVVDLGPDTCRVQRHPTGTWRFVEKESDLHVANDVDVLEHWLSELPQKELTILRLHLTGGLGLGLKARLDTLLDETREVFAGLQERSEELVVLAEEVDVGELGLSGFARATVEKLAERSATSLDARDALTLLYRLAGGAAR